MYLLRNTCSVRGEDDDVVTRNEIALLFCFKEIPRVFLQSVVKVVVSLLALEFSYFVSLSLSSLFLSLSLSEEEEEEEERY